MATERGRVGAVSECQDGIVDCGLWIASACCVTRLMMAGVSGHYSDQGPTDYCLSLSLSRLNMIQHQLSPARSLLAQAKRPRGSETVVLSTDDGS